MEKQTSVEWLVENLISEPYSEQDFEHNFQCWEQAKQMEKEIIRTAYLDGMDGEYNTSEQYYNETFKSE